MGSFFGQGFSCHLDPAYSHRVQGIFDGDDCEVAADDGWGCVTRTDGVGVGGPDDAEQRRPIGDVDALAAGPVGQEQFFGKLRFVVTLFEADARIAAELAGNDVRKFCQGMAAADIETGREGAERRKFQLILVEQVLQETGVHVG